jgi:hypothetical protein
VRSADVSGPTGRWWRAPQSRAKGIIVLVTEIGFVSLLVAGFGALAGGLVYLAVRLSRSKP